MTEKALGAVVNDTALVAGRKGLYLAFSLPDSFPNEWWQLRETGATTLTIDTQHLPQVARQHNPVLKAVTWAAQVTGAPASYPITVGGTGGTLNRDPAMPSRCVGTLGTVSWGTPIAISCDPAKLTDLSVLVSYTIS